MALESASWITQLVSTNPAVGDPVGEGDDHLRMIKAVLQNSFPSSSTSAVIPNMSGQSGKVLSTDGTDSFWSDGFLRSDADDTWSGNISTTSTNGFRFGSANETDANDGYIAAGKFASGLNIVGTQTTAGTGRQVRIWGEVLTSAGSKFWNAGNDGSGSGLDADTVDGVHSSGFVQTTYNTSLNSDTRNSRGPTRLYRRDSDNDYSVQTYWTGARWRLYGYVGDSNHADTHVGYAEDTNTLDGINSTSFCRSDANDVVSGHINFTGGGAGAWNNRTILLERPTGPGIGFHSYNHSAAGMMYYAGSANDFRFKNSVDTGYIPIRASAFTVSSDYRLKENIVPIEGAIDKIKQIKPYSFNFIDKPDVTIDGYLAHELAEVVPHAVSGTKDEILTEEYEITPAVFNDEGVETTAAVMGTREVPEYQGVDLSKVTPLIVAALKEALEKIESLEQRVTTLEA